MTFNPKRSFGYLGFKASLRLRFSTTVLALVCSTLQNFATQLPRATPETVSISATRLAQMDQAVEQAIARHELPGAVVLVARKGRVVWCTAYGSRAVQPTREPMTPDTIFDLASLTKVVATATSVMILVERGKVRLSDPVSRYIPELKGGGREKITIEHLLTHRAGYAPDFDLKERWSGYEEAIKRLVKEPLRNPPGTRFVYSDINYIALGEVVHRISGLTLDEFAGRNIFVPLGMHDTGFQPDQNQRARIAPTEKRRGQLSYLGDTPQNAGAEAEKWLRGEVHDPTSYRMGGVAGHAGLFSTADDLARYCQMILNGGQYHGVRILSPLTVAEMTRPRLVSTEGWTRGLGWDLNTTYSTNRGDLFPLGSFGHTGFTGTSIWIDPASQMFVIFLSNRVHPDGKGDVGPLRGRVASIVAAAVTDTKAVARARRQLSNYYTDIVRDLSRFTSSRDEGTTGVSPGTVPSPENRVLTGIDVLERDGFKQLAGMRVGLITNQTGNDRMGHSTIDVLLKAPGVKLVALFSPEHGIRGLVDEKVSDSKDERTGLPIYSLYGASYRIRLEQLNGIDALVFDIQDIGTRYYTYIATMGESMEEAAKARIPFFVLDRPNPVNGVDIEGPMREDDELRRWTHSCSSVDISKSNPDALRRESYHRLPLRHGMTVGELALLFNTQRKIGCDLRVIKMVGWRRAMWFDETGLTWVNPSPNMRSLTQATIYPGIELLKKTGLSVGRGTDTPFEIIGAPWLDGQRLAAYLNQRSIGGVRFVPIRFSPKEDPFRGQECGGINIIITDRSRYHPVYTGLEIAIALRRLYPADWQADCYGFLLANEDTLERVKRGETADEIVRSWNAQLEEFRSARTRNFLYD